MHVLFRTSRGCSAVTSSPKLEKITELLDAVAGQSRPETRGRRVLQGPRRQADPLCPLRRDGAAAERHRHRAARPQRMHREIFRDHSRPAAPGASASATFDWRGQGRSDRLMRNPRRGYVDRFDSYVRDLEQFFDEIVLPDCRGPSTCLPTPPALSLRAGRPPMGNRVRRMVLIAPLIELSGLPLSMRERAPAGLPLY